MILRLRTVPAALAVAMVAVLLGTGLADARPALAGPSVNACANPDLATDANGWEAVVGSGGRNRTDTVWVFSVLNPKATTAAVGLPAFEVRPGQSWSVAVRVRHAYDVSRMRMEVDWFSAAGTPLGHVDGDFQRVGPGHTLSPVSGVFTVPAEAETADVVVRSVDGLYGAFDAAGCSYRLNPLPR